MLSSAWEFQKCMGEHGYRLGQGLVNKFGKAGHSYSYLYYCEDDELVLSYLTDAIYCNLK